MEPRWEREAFTVKKKKRRGAERAPSHAFLYTPSPPTPTEEEEETTALLQRPERRRGSFVKRVSGERKEG